MFTHLARASNQVACARAVELDAPMRLLEELRAARVVPEVKGYDEI